MESVLKTSTTILACGSVAVYAYIMYKKWKKHVLDEYIREIKEATSNFATEIGSGLHGASYLGVLKSGDQIVVKVYNHTVQPEEEVKRLKDVQKKLGRRNTIDRVLIIDRRLCLVSSYAASGSLAAVLSNQSTRLHFRWERRLRVLLSLVTALQDLHSRDPPIIHGNLKPTNVLINDRDVAKITDFHIYDLVRDGSPSIYTDPEYLCTGVLTQECDLYSLGIIVLEILTGRLAGDAHFGGQTIIEWVGSRLIYCKQLFGIQPDQPRPQFIFDPALTEILDDVLQPVPFKQGDKIKVTLCFAMHFCRFPLGARCVQMPDLDTLLFGMEVLPGNPDVQMFLDNIASWYADACGMRRLRIAILEDL